MTAHFILFVADQKAATHFYSEVLQQQPRLQVVGMSEFKLAGGAVLGLMPVEGARRLFGEDLLPPGEEAGPLPVESRPSQAGGPRSELYLLLERPEAVLERAQAAGARVLSPVCARDWGDRAGYCLDRDGHLLAFAARPAPASWFSRLHSACGPLAAGMVLDGLDLVTFGPLGLYLGPVIGLLAGW